MLFAFYLLPPLVLSPDSIPWILTPTASFSMLHGYKPKQHNSLADWLLVASNQYVSNRKKWLIILPYLLVPVSYFQGIVLSHRFSSRVPHSTGLSKHSTVSFPSGLSVAAQGFLLFPPPKHFNIH